MLRKIVALVALLASTGAAPASEMKVTIKVDGYSEADAMVALDALRRNCRPLGAEFWGDIETVEVTIEEETAPYRQKRGWKNSVYVRLKYADDPRYGPSYASGIGGLAGHWFDFFLGGGWEPGIFIGKRHAQYLCGLSFHPKGDVIFVPVEQLKFIDR